jgi:hypothetical protein
MHIPTWLPSVVAILAGYIGGFIHSRILKPADVDRANSLDAIARGAASLVVSLNPGKDWAALLDSTVQMILSAAGLPTQNKGAIERAAAAALMNAKGRNAATTAITMAADHLGPGPSQPGKN